MKKLIITSSIVVLLDQAIKIILSIFNVDSINVINNFFKITLVHNYGAAWSLLNGYRLFLIVVSILELFIIYNIFIKNQKVKNGITLGMLIGGIIGNLIDRIIYGYVIDYLDFNIFGYNYPVFNLADSMIVISIILLILFINKGDTYDSRKRSQKN